MGDVWAHLLLRGVYRVNPTAGGIRQPPRCLLAVWVVGYFRYLVYAFATTPVDRSQVILKVRKPPGSLHPALN